MAVRDEDIQKFSGCGFTKKFIAGDFLKKEKISAFPYDLSGSAHIAIYAAGRGMIMRRDFRIEPSGQAKQIIFILQDEADGKRKIMIAFELCI